MDFSRANRRFDVELITGKHTVGLKEGRAAAAIDKVLASRNKMRALEQYESWFNGLRKSFVPRDNQGENARQSG